MRFSKVTFGIYPLYDPHRVIVRSKNSIYLQGSLPANKSLVVPSVFVLDQGSCFHDHKLLFGSTFSRFVLQVAQLLSLTMVISLHQQSTDRLA